MILCIVTVMDARNLEFIPDQCFDLIIDKGLYIFLLNITMILSNSTGSDISFWFGLIFANFAALFDAVLCSENNLKDIQSFLKEMYRVLKTGGVYLLISHGAPDNRVNHIKRYIDVDIDVVPIRKL